MYGVAKHACRIILEDYCKNIAQQFVWMQFSNIYGVGNKTGNLVSYTLGELMAGKKKQHLVLLYNHMILFMWMIL